MSCSQSGAVGPPFSPAVQQDESSLLLRLRRWLPWEWYSIDGSGWCYDADWDRMQRCAEMDVPVDWNGVGAAPAPPWFGVEERGLLVAVLLSGAVLTCDAELTRAPRGPRRVSTGDAATRTSLPRAVRTGGAGRPAFQGPTYWTHWVRVPAIRVPAIRIPNVPRAMAPQVLCLSAVGGGAGRLRRRRPRHARVAAFPPRAAVGVGAERPPRRRRHARRAARRFFGAARAADDPCDIRVVRLETHDPPLLTRRGGSCFTPLPEAVPSVCFYPCLA